MGAENANPLEELQDLGRRIDQAADLDSLKPIFARVDQLAKLHSGDLEVQLSTEDLKQRIVERGKTLRQEGEPTGRPKSTKIDSPIVEPSVAVPPPQATDPADSTQSKSVTVRPSAPKPDALPPKPPQAAKPPRKGGWTGPLTVGVIAGAVIAVLIIALLVNQARKGLFSGKQVQVQVTTVPPGASIRVNGEAKCQSNCAMQLDAPGNYQITAFLDGYEAAAASVALERGRPRQLSMELLPARQSLRILTDLPQGSVIIDDQPPLELQDGQFAIDNVQPGKHSVKITSRTGEAAFTMDVEPAKLPSVDGPISVKNLVALAAATMGNSAKVYASSGPQKLALNGNPQGDVGPAGVDLTGYQAGTAELAVGEGKDQKVVSDTFSPAPALTLFLKSDLNIGTLVVNTGEDDVRVFVNDKEAQRRTKRGQLRVPAIGNVTVRVAKDGFEPVAPQTAEVKKGAEARLDFKLQASPKFAALLLRGATPGAEVLLDQKSVGTVGDDGSFADNAVPPGDHTVELRRDQYLPKRFQRSFRAGQSITVAGAEAVLTSALGTIKVARTPADASITYRRADEAAGQGREIRGAQIDLPPGAYIFTARAPGYTDKSERVQVAPGDNQSVELALARVVAAAPPPAPKAGGMEGFESGAWMQQGDVWVHKGGGVVPYKAVPNGVFTFTVQLLKGGNLFRGGKIRWVVQYVDAKNYNLFELDRKSLSSKVIQNGKTLDRGKFDHSLSEKDKAYTIQIDSRREHLVTKFMVNGEWKTIDSWDEADRDFTAGKFGFLIQGSDEIGLSDFKFVPR